MRPGGVFWPLLLLILIVLSGPHDIAAQTPAEFLIVPGERIGNWSLSMSLADLVAALGPRYGESPERSGLPGGNLYDFVEHNVLVIFCVNSRRVMQIGVYRSNNPARQEVLARYRTAEGIGLDSPLSAVIAAYGQPTWTYDWGGGYKGHPFRNGLYVNVDPQGKISYIAVYPGFWRC